MIEQVQVAREFGYVAVHGDATLDETPLRVGIQQAICLVTALPSDAENLYAILSAKTLNPQKLNQILSPTQPKSLRLPRHA